MDEVTHHERTTAYRYEDRDGDGRPLLCIHGSGSTHEIWAAQFRLATDRPVVALDLSGHGDSDDIDAEPGYETLSAYVDDVIAVARETDAGILMGNSLGGAIALTLALERDYDLDGLVLAGTGAKLAVLEDLLLWLENDFDRAIEFLHGDDRLFHDPDDEYIERSTRAMRDTGQAVAVRDFRTCHDFDVRDRLDQIEVPSLAIVGQYDRLTPPRYHEYFADNMPNCVLAVVEDAAHLTMLEQPAAFNATLREFFAERVPEPELG